MTPKCPACDSENLDQGVDRTILCHDCKTIFELVRVHQFTFDS